MADKNYDSTIMRIAGNLLSGSEPDMSGDDDGAITALDITRIKWAVAVARGIVAETITSAPHEPTKS